MEFENTEFGQCKLLNCDYAMGKNIILIKNNSTKPYVVTTNLLKDNNWVKGVFFSTYDLAKKYYDELKQ